MIRLVGKLSGVTATRSQSSSTSDLLPVVAECVALLMDRSIDELNGFGLAPIHIASRLSDAKEVKLLWQTSASMSTGETLMGVLLFIWR